MSLHPATRNVIESEDLGITNKLKAMAGRRDMSETMPGLPPQASQMSEFLKTMRENERRGPIREGKEQAKQMKLLNKLIGRQDSFKKSKPKERVPVDYQEDMLTKSLEGLSLGNKSQILQTTQSTFKSGYRYEAQQAANIKSELIRRNLMSRKDLMTIYKPPTKKSQIPANNPFKKGAMMPPTYVEQVENVLTELNNENSFLNFQSSKFNSNYQPMNSTHIRAEINRSF